MYVSAFVYLLVTLAPGIGKYLLNYWFQIGFDEQHILLYRIKYRVVFSTKACTNVVLKNKANNIKGTPENKVDTVEQVVTKEI